MSARENLKQCLKDYLEWANGGEGTVRFKRYGGLCFNTLIWGNKFLGYSDERLDFLNLFDSLIDRDFDEYNRSYPFGGRDQYYFEVKTYTVHTNKDRLAWVKKIIEELE